jgi:N-acetylglucosaminyldiphosphoundecaprenol N-acetyl-beta-D-mannosaminyltransferase
MKHFVRILNIDILSIKLNNLLRILDTGVVFTPNVDHIMKLQKNHDFYNAYQNADWLICDSKILSLASKFLGNSFQEVIPGSSLLPAFYEYHKVNPEIKIFLLGAAEGVAIKAMLEINNKVGREIIVGAHSPSFGFDKSELECSEIIELINKSDASVLVVGVGAPKQEIWINKYKSKFTKIKLFMALGATIDFEAGNIKRAPVLFQKLGVEWLFRLLNEPKRLWKRYLVDDIPFFYYIFKQKKGMYKNPFSA